MLPSPEERRRMREEKAAQRAEKQKKQKDGIEKDRSCNSCLMIKYGVNQATPVNLTASEIVSTLN